MILSELFKALGDENRLRILNLLIKEELCVCEVEMVLNMTQSNVSRHLSKLKSMGLISSYKKAQWVYYEIDSNFISKYPLLYEFLQNESEKSTEYIRDIEILAKYKKSNCSFVEYKESYIKDNEFYVSK
ncbi:MAG: transcriptional regulator [Firmicutes bacterium HGW-Firmicutes-7]|nr:MAG: transcriptional regulator [Firmicutes bacterium HGW-Firmicutes-7]